MHAGYSFAIIDHHEMAQRSFNIKTAKMCCFQYSDFILVHGEQLVAFCHFGLQLQSVPAKAVIFNSVINCFSS